jgi:hypothetical protein
MRACPECGAPLEHEDDRFCGVCGAAVPPPAPSVAPEGAYQAVGLASGAAQYSTGLKLLLYAVSFLLPPAGIIPGIVFLTRPDRESKRLGLVCLIITGVASILAVILTCVMLSLLDWSMTY